MFSEISNASKILWSLGSRNFLWWRGSHMLLLTAVHKPTASWYHACKLHIQHKLCLLSCGLIIHAYPLICKSSWWSYKKNYKGIIVGWMCQFHSWSGLCSTWSPWCRPELGSAPWINLWNITQNLCTSPSHKMLHIPENSHLYSPEMLSITRVLVERSWGENTHVQFVEAFHSILVVSNHCEMLKGVCLAWRQTPHRGPRAWTNCSSARLLWRCWIKLDVVPNLQEVLSMLPPCNSRNGREVL